MDKITKPMAVLISGVLIFIGLLILSSSLKDEYYYHVDTTSTSAAWLVKTHKVTGLSCYTSANTVDVFKDIPEGRDSKWVCIDTK